MINEEHILSEEEYRKRQKENGWNDKEIDDDIEYFRKSGHPIFDFHVEPKVITIIEENSTSCSLD